jgi:putative transposase
MEKLRTHYPAGALSDALEVSKSGFHAHRHKPGRPRRQRDAQLRPLIAQSFTHSRRTYGSPRVHADLRALGQCCGKNRVARLMRDQGLCARQKRRFKPRTTDSRHPHPIAPNWLAKVPAPERPGQIWVSDFTYLPTAEGWLYLAFTLDGCSRKVVGHHGRDDMRAELVTSTFEQAVRRERPLAGLIHHSDRGAQYACAAFQSRLAACGVTPSMSRPGNPYDNAMAESFVATLKAECFGDSVPPTKTAARLMAFDYIETFYNPRRRHSSLGYLSPVDFEKQIVPLEP